MPLPEYTLKTDKETGAVAVQIATFAGSARRILQSKDAILHVAETPPPMLVAISGVLLTADTPTCLCTCGQYCSFANWYIAGFPDIMTQSIH